MFYDVETSSSGEENCWNHFSQALASAGTGTGTGAGTANEASQDSQVSYASHLGPLGQLGQLSQVGQVGQMDQAGQANQASQASQASQESLPSQADDICLELVQTLISWANDQSANPLDFESFHYTLELYSTKLHSIVTLGMDHVVWYYIASLSIFRNKWQNRVPPVFHHHHLDMTQLTREDIDAWFNCFAEVMCLLSVCIKRVNGGDTNILELMIYANTACGNDLHQSLKLQFVPTLQRRISYFVSRPEEFEQMKQKMFFKDMPKDKVLMQFVQEVYDRLFERGAAIRDDLIYLPVFYKGHKTNAYKVAGPVEDVVRSLFSMTHNAHMMYMSLENSSIVSITVETVLKQRQELYLPYLQPNRTVWSFSDGIYDGNTDTFYPYPHNISTVSAKFVENNVSEFCHLQDFLDIPVPICDYIIGFQLCKDFENPSEDEIQGIRLLWGMIGRLYHKVGKDNLQRVLFLIGAAGTGKSMLLNQATSAYEAGMVASIGPDTQQTFGLENLYQKLLVTVTEVPAHGGLTQELFKQMSAGDPVAVNRKNRTTLNLPSWEVQMAWAMNNLPGWRDMGGSLGRRLFTFFFKKKPPKQDGSFHEKLPHELGAFIVKACKAYKWMMEALEDAEGDFLSLWPPQIKQFHDTCLGSLNPIEAFFNDPSAVTYEPDTFVRYDKLQRACQYYMKKNNLGEFDARDMTFICTIEDLGRRVEGVKVDFVEDITGGKVHKVQVVRGMNLAI